jgi:hypothetical protein
MNANLERKAQERRRRVRLAESLRENLKRRKAQQRGRASEDSAGGPERKPAPGVSTSRPSDAGEG